MERVEIVKEDTAYKVIKHLSNTETFEFLVLKDELEALITFYANEKLNQ